MLENKQTVLITYNSIKIFNVHNAYLSLSPPHNYIIHTRDIKDWTTFNSADKFV